MAIAKYKLMDAVAVDNATVNSSSINLERIGSGGAVAVRFISSAAGSLTVTQQCSHNDIDWYTPKDKSNVAISPIVPAATGADSGRWIVFDISFAPFVRFQCVEAGTLATNVTIDFYFLEKEG